jgi:O-antigen/teichoic acid export membrane protein
VAGALAVAAVVVLAAIGGPLISLTVGDAYLGAYGVLVVVAAATAISIFGVALDPVFFAMGRPEVMLWVSVIVAALNLVLVVLFAAAWGLIGVGWASLVSTVVGMAVLTMLALARLAKRVHGEDDAAAREHQGGV